MIMSLRIVAILSLLEICRAYTPAAKNPSMLTHASMDVGNIISIVIPESPDENINVDQLTGEFRQQLERIKKQSRASKVEHGLVTLKKVLPEMSREEKRKTLPLIRRVLHGRRLANSGSMKNRTREAHQRMEQINEAGQLVRSHSAGKPEEKKIFRDYEEPINHEVVTTRTLQTITEKDDYRRVNEETNANRREEEPREDPIRRNDKIRQGELAYYDDPSHREDHANLPYEDQSLSKIARLGSPQEWNNRNWEGQSGDPRNYPETSTDLNDKSDGMLRQKERRIDILQNDRYEKLGRISELDQQIHSRYPILRQDVIDNTKRLVKDGREYRLTDLAGFINYARELDINEASNLDYDNAKRNYSSDDNRDVAFDKQRLEATNVARETSRGLQKIIQDPRRLFESSNSSGLENIVSESADGYSSKKKRGYGYSNDLRRFSSIQSTSGNRMTSNDIKAPANMFEILADKEMNPAVNNMQKAGDNFRSNFDGEPGMAASQNFRRYHGNGRILRIRRNLNSGSGSDQKNESADGYSSKKKRGYGYSNDLRRFSSIQSTSGNRMTSNDIKAPDNMFEILADKEINPSVNNMQTAGDNFRSNFDGEPGMAASQNFRHYHGNDRILRNRRNLNSGSGSDQKNESADGYSSKKKRGYGYSNDLRRFSSIQSTSGNRMTSNDIKAPANMFEILADKEMNPAVNNMQTAGDNFRSNFDGEPGMSASQNFRHYHGNGRILRIRRNLNAGSGSDQKNENVDGYSSKKKRGYGYSNDFRRFSSIQSTSGNRMTSNDIKAPANMFEILADKEINPAVNNMQTAGDNFRSNFDGEPGMAASQNFRRYHGNGRILRIRRNLNSGSGSDQKNESADGYSSKKKRGYGYSNDLRRFSSIQSTSGNRMTSNDIKAPANMFEILADKEMNPAVNNMQTAGDNSRSNFDGEPGMSASQNFRRYHGNGRILRIRRNLNAGSGSDRKNETLGFLSSALLDRIFKTAQNPKFIILYTNGSAGHNEKTHNAFTEPSKSQSTVSSSILEPSTSTSLGVSVVMESTTNLPRISTIRKS